MKDLLYLKDEQIKEFIEKLFLTYRDTFSDSKSVLNKYSLGIAHNKVLHILSTYKGITIGELLDKLKITKQSINRVLRDLLKEKMVKQIKDEKDTRKKKLYIDSEGKTYFEMIYKMQKKRIFNALKNSEPDSVVKFKEVLKKIING